MDFSLITRHKKTIVISSISIVVVAFITFFTLFFIQKAAKSAEQAHEAEIAAQVSGFQGKIIESYEAVALALNSLANDIYHDGENILPLTGDRINQYVERLDALKAPDDTLEGIISDYRTAWYILKDNFDAKKYEETQTALTEVQRLAAKTSDKINSAINTLISAQISAYEQSLRDERP